MDHSRFFVGGFVEGSLGKYDITAYSGTIGDPRLDAEGDLRSLAFGLMARQRFDNGFRIEASGRVGRNQMEFRSDYFTNQQGHNLDVKMNMPFFAAHGGLGYEWQINDLSSLDLVGRYYWTRQNGKSVTLESDEIVDFLAATSHRVRAGARYTRQKRNSRLFYYGGAYWEREFDGKSIAFAHGQQIDSNELKGDTGIGEIGLIVKSNQNDRLSIEAGIQGYAGMNRGFSGGFRLNYEF
jgi:outer membrane autotransporter protein